MLFAFLSSFNAAGASCKSSCAAVVCCRRFLQVILCSCCMLQALPASHPVQLLYAADVAQRQLLAATSSESLLASGAVRHRLTPTAGSSSSSIGEVAENAGLQIGESLLDQKGAESSQGAVPSSSRSLQHLAPQIAGQQQQHMRESQQQQQQQQRQRPYHISLQQQPPQQQPNRANREVDEAAASVQQHQTGPAAGVRQYVCGSWQLELDEAQGEGHHNGAAVALLKKFSTVTWDVEGICCGAWHWPLRTSTPDQFLEVQLQCIVMRLLLFECQKWMTYLLLCCRRADLSSEAVRSAAHTRH
jgi:hypothetical protein